jgi:hypothetical protein
MRPDDTAAPPGDRRDSQAAPPAHAPAHPPLQEDDLDDDDDLHEQLAHLSVEVAPVADHAITFIEADEVRPLLRPSLAAPPAPLCRLTHQQHRFYEDADSTLGEDVSVAPAAVRLANLQQRQ